MYLFLYYIFTYIYTHDKYIYTYIYMSQEFKGGLPPHARVRVFLLPPCGPVVWVGLGLAPPIAYHCISLHVIALHCIALHVIALHVMHVIALQCIAVR